LYLRTAAFGLLCLTGCVCAPRVEFAAIQTDFARSPIFDGVYNLFTPETLGSVQQGSPVTFWLNVEVFAQQFFFFLDK